MTIRNHGFLTPKASLMITTYTNGTGPKILACQLPLLACATSLLLEEQLPVGEVLIGSMQWVPEFFKL